jgi:hypothetical protein
VLRNILYEKIEEKNRKASFFMLSGSTYLSVFLLNEVSKCKTQAALEKGTTGMTPKRKPYEMKDWLDRLRQVCLHDPLGSSPPPQDSAWSAVPLDGHIGRRTLSG